MSSPVSAEVPVSDRFHGALAEDLPSPAGGNPVDVLEAGLGYRFADRALLTTALTHRSWSAENGGDSNERLEFLGDAVLGLAVTDRVYRTNPDLAEGELAKIRSSVVSAGALTISAREVSLGDALLLGRGEEASGGREKDSILSDALEAVIGAVFLDGGHVCAVRLVHDLLGDPIDLAALDPGIHDHKTRLQELAAQRFGSAPSYLLTADGPAHDRRFHASVEVGGRSFGPGTGKSKKRAEQVAAHIAWDALSGGDWSAGAVSEADMFEERE